MIENDNTNKRQNSTIGMIPNDWEIKKLGDICPLFKSGQNITSKDISTEGKYPVFGGNGLRGYTNKFTHDGQYILIGRQGALCGNINIVKGKCYISEHAIAVNTNQNFSWLRYKLEYWNLNRFSESSAQPGLSVNKLIKYKLSVPTLTEQQRIADILSLWDKAIEKQSQLISQLELRKKGLMQQLLTGKKRLSGFRGKWKTYILSEICKRVVRKNSEGNTNVMTISAQQGFVKQTDFFNKSVASESLDGYLLVKKDEFCYNKSYSNGYPMGAIKRLKEAEKAVVTTLYICFKVIDEKTTDINFLEQLFNIGILNKGLTKVANEGGRAHGLLNVTPRDFFELKINIPTIEEQKSISKIIKAIDKEIEVEKNKFKFFCNQKTGLMQQLLTGKIRVK